MNTYEAEVTIKAISDKTILADIRKAGWDVSKKNDDVIEEKGVHVLTQGSKSYDDAYILVAKVSSSIDLLRYRIVHIIIDTAKGIK